MNLKKFKYLTPDAQVTLSIWASSLFPNLDTDTVKVREELFDRGDNIVEHLLIISAKMCGRYYNESFFVEVPYMAIHEDNFFMAE